MIFSDDLVDKHIMDQYPLYIISNIPAIPVGLVNITLFTPKYPIFHQGAILKEVGYIIE